MKPSLAAILLVIVATPAFAAANTPSLSGNSWIAIAIVLGLVAVVVLFIRGALGVSKNDKSDDDDAGVGILEGIDDDDEDKKKKKR